MTTKIPTHSKIPYYTMYLDSLWRESERLFLLKKGRKMKINRDTIKNYSKHEGFLEFDVRQGRDTYPFCHYINLKWSLRKNVWDLINTLDKKMYKHSST